MKKAKGYKKGGKVCPTCKSAKCSCNKMKKGGKVDVGGVKMKSGGMCRGGGAATRGMNISKKMG